MYYAVRDSLIVPAIVVDEKGDIKIFEGAWTLPKHLYLK